MFLWESKWVCLIFGVWGSPHTFCWGWWRESKEGKVLLSLMWCWLQQPADRSRRSSIKWQSCPGGRRCLQGYRELQTFACYVCVSNMPILDMSFQAAVIKSLFIPSSSLWEVTAGGAGTCTSGLCLKVVPAKWGGLCFTAWRLLMFLLH